MMSFRKLMFIYSGNKISVLHNYKTNKYIADIILLLPTEQILIFNTKCKSNLVALTMSNSRRDHN